MLFFLFFCFSISSDNKNIEKKQNDKINSKINKLEIEIKKLNNKIIDCDARIKLTLKYNMNHKLPATSGLNSIINSKNKYIRKKKDLQKKLEEIKVL